MTRRRIPLLVPGTALVAGAALGQALPGLPIPALVLALGLSVGLPRGWRLPVLCFAAGLLRVAVVEAESGGAVSGGRPLTAEVRLREYWTREGAGWRARVLVETIRQGHQVTSPGSEAILRVSSEGQPPLGCVLRVRTVGAIRDQQLPWQPPPRQSLRVKSWRLVEARPGRGLWDLGQRLHRTVAERVRLAGWGPGGRLLRALLLGDRTALPDAWKRGLKRCGLAHVLAVSGLHVALLAGVALLAARRLGRAWGLAAAAAAVGAYVLLVGPRPSLLRASAMAAAALLALASRRRPQAVNALAGVIAVLVFRSPRVLCDLGFRLSAAATAALVTLAPELATRWRVLPAGLARALAATVAAQLVTLPLTLPRFAVLNPLAPFFNLLAVPWVGSFLIAGATWLAVCAVSPAAGLASAGLLDALAAPVSWAAAPRPAAVGVGLLAVSPAVAMLLTASLLAAAWRPRRLLWAVLLAALLRTREAEGVDPDLVMLDVGQGEAVLLRDGPEVLLLDGGGWRFGDVASSVLVPDLARLGVRRLQAMALTHADLDHCDGLVGIAAYVEIEEVWLVPEGRSSRCREELLALPGTSVLELWAGARRAVGRWRLEVLSPSAAGGSGGNATSMVLRAGIGARRVLLTGDLEAAGELRLLAHRPEALPADVLKVPHHGSGTSSTAAFLERVAPRLALLSAGRRNPYAHPDPSVLERLRAVHAWVLRTDREGSVRLEFGPAGEIRVLVGERVWQGSERLTPGASRRGR